MLGLSLLFHLSVFSAILFVPETNSGLRPLKGMVYEVNLVEMPGGKAGGTRQAAAKKEAKKKIPQKKTAARRIKTPAKKKKPLVVAKRTIEKKVRKARKPKKSPSQIIEKAISRIESKVKKEDEKSHIERALSKLENQIEEGGGAGRSGGRSIGGMPMEIYRMEAENWIKSNWSFPVAMDSAKDLEAVVVIMVKKGGAIIKTRFEKRSPNVMFNDSVTKAIEKSDPLPPFPEGYRKSYEEFVINFNLKDLETR
jgi:colicin import membrane protein